MKTTRAMTGMRLCWILAAGGIAGELSAEVAPVNRTPYIATYYIQPKVNLGDPATIDYYVTDFEHKEYLDDDISERFVIDYWVNGVKGVLTNVPAGDRSLNLGVLPKGNVLFAFQATDRLGIKSHRLYQEFRVVDPAEEAIPPGEVLHPDLAAFNISSNDTEPVATTAGLTALIKWASTNGYRKVVLPQGRYRIHESNTVQMASGVTLDLNGSTFKQNPNALAKTLLLEMAGCVDAHVVNGILEGDLLEHDFANAPNNSEWLRAISISLGSSYCSAENLVVTNVTGYGTCCVHEQPAYAFYNHIGIGNTFIPGDIDDQGLDIPSGHRTTSSNYLDIRAFVNTHNFIYVGLDGGYLGNPAGHWVYKAHFYDASKQHLESIEGYLYRRLYLPPNACFARFTLFSTSQPADLTVSNRRSPYNCAYRNIRHVNVRCVGMALAGMNNMLVEGCRFDNCGWASATCAFDAEDGWDLMQDLTFRSNVFGVNPRNEFLTCAGHNFVMENNIMKAYMWDRSKNFVFRANSLKSAVYRFGSLLRSGYARIAGNDNQGKATLILDTTLPDKRHYVRDESYTNGVAGPTGGWLGFRRCAITGGAMNAHAVRCSLLNVTNTGGAFGIVDSVVSNSTLKQSQLTVARLENSQVVNSRLHVQGGMIIATSNQLINTDCAVTGDWNTNHVFCLTGNRIDIPKATFLTVGNTFKQMLFTNNVVNATAAGFNFVTLSNPMNSGAGSLSNMWVCFTGNTFNGNGGLVLKSSAPAATSRLFVDFHTNIYNNLALHSTALANKANVILSVRPALPTELSVTLTADIIPENAGAGAMTVTVTRYMNITEALTVHLASSDPALLSVPVTVVIPAGQTAVTFTVDMIDNDDQTGHQSETVTASADGFTAGSAAVAVHDDELASLLLATAGSPFQLAEGAATNYTVALGTIPTAPVTVTLVPQAPLLISPSALTFSAADWNIPQTVTLTHPDTDTLADPPRLLDIGHTLASTDAAYEALAVDPLVVTISDNDLPVLTLTAAATSISEAAGNAATTVTLSRNTPATNALSVAMTSSLPETLRIESPAVIPLGADSVTLAVDVLDDAVIEPDTPVTLSATAAGFAGDAVVIEVTDDDTPPIAITNTVVYAESFETLAEGAPLLPARGWYAGTTQACVVVRDTYAYSRPLPLATTHTQYATISETVTNRIARAGSQPTWVDMMIAPRLGEPDAMVGEAETGVYFNDTGRLMLFHRDLAGGTNRWTELEHPAVATGTWVRLTAAFDDETEDPVHPGIRYLRLFLNGRAISSGAAYTDNDGSGVPGGYWFAMHRPSPAPVGEISFHSGPCNLDDLTVTTQPPRTPGGTPWSWLARYGLAADDDASDNDADGFTAAEEHIAETDPEDPNSFFKILAIFADPADAARIGVPSAAGRRYTLEGRSSLEAASWLPLGEMTDVPGTGEMLWLTDTNATPARFFRVKVRLEE